MIDELTTHHTKAIPELLYPGGNSFKSTRPQGAATLRIGPEDTLTQELP
jgi:hypothetical protein